MKKLQLFILLLICTKAGMSQQLLLSGTIKGIAKHDPIEINAPYDGNYWKKKSVYLKPDAAGNFHISFPSGREKFIILVYKEKQHYLLLSPGRPLYVTISAKLPYLLSFSGKGRVENDLLQKLKLESADNLPFIKDVKLNGYKSYANWSIDSIINIKLPVIKRSLDSTQQVVRNTMLPISIKKTLATEIKYYYACAIAEDLGSRLNIRKNRTDFNARFIDSIWSDFALPSKDELDITINANHYLETYLRFKTWKAVFIYSQDKNKDHAEAEFKNYTGVGFKDLMNDPDKTNEIYLFSTRLKTVAPQYAWEKNLTNLLFSFCMQGQLQSADKLLHFIRLNCSNKQYIAASEKMFIPLKASREQYASNLDIKIRPGYRNISSIKTLLEPYKGKIVFVDLWGTWCPHCIEDMAYEPELKKRFKGRDIVFLYIADDEDKNDEVWRDFIFINNLTGEHVRRTTDQMAGLWNELGIPDSKQGYPHYFIFDQLGNMANNDAKRPGDGDALYNQLELALNNK